MTIIYKLGNFASGKILETESKQVRDNAIFHLGYTLITVAFLTTAEYLDWSVKK